MWQLISACLSGSTSTHADGEQTITTQLDVPESAGVRTWCVNEHDNVLMFNPAAVVLGNHVG